MEGALGPRARFRGPRLARVVVLGLAAAVGPWLVTLSLDLELSTYSDAAPVTFVSGLPQGSGLRCEAPGCRTALLAAAKQEQPAGKPKRGRPEEPQEEVWDPSKPNPNEETTDMQADRVTKFTHFLRRVKHKFTPMGPKPFDKPRFTKTVIRVRLDPKQAANTKILKQVVEEVRRISGAHPKIMKGMKNDATRGWRKGMPAGVQVEIQGRLMQDFLKRLNMIVLPRIRDFEGLAPTSFNPHGDFWMTIDSQEPFKELDEMIDQRELVHSFDVGLVNNCLTQPDGLELMKKYGFPFGDPRPRRPPKALRKKMRLEATWGAATVKKVK